MIGIEFASSSVWVIILSFARAGLGARWASPNPALDAEHHMALGCIHADQLHESHRHAGHARPPRCVAEDCTLALLAATPSGGGPSPAEH